MFTNPISARRPFVTAALALVLSAAVPSAQTPAAPGYKTYDQLTASLRALAQSHGNLVKLVDLGKSHEGRSVWAVEIAGAPAGSTPADQRPALLLAANLEGDQLIGSELALYLAQHLAASYASDARVKTLLDEHAVYILPRINPDGAEQMFGNVKSFRRTNAGKFDADNDGRMDEDGPEDLNGDGFISVMRVKDPKGVYMTQPDDARLMKRADAQKGEAGGWSIYWEGLDNDADGFINEDGPGGIDLNRNFQHKYPYYTADAGPYMVSEPETRAVMNYMLKHRNVAAILTYGASDNLISATTPQGALGAAQPIDLLAFADASIAGARTVGTFSTNQGPQGFFGFGGRGGPPPQTRPPGQPAPRPPATTVNAQDVEYFRTISDRYRELTNVRTAPVTRAPEGAFFEYGYYQFGVPSFSTPGWGLPAAPAAPAAAAAPATSAPARPASAASPAGSFDAKLVKAVADGFIDWKPFTHPTLGAVEIGGFKPYAVTNPAASEIDALGKSHAEFAMYLTTLFPRIAVADLKAAPLGGGLYRITAEIENAGYLPTSTAQGVTSRAVSPVMVQLGVAPDAIVSGAAKTSFVQALAGSGRRESYQWIVRGKPGQSVAVKAVAEKGGAAERTVVLK